MSYIFDDDDDVYLSLHVSPILLCLILLEDGLLRPKHVEEFIPLDVG